MTVSARSIHEQIRTFIAENLLFSADGYPLKDEESFLESGVVDSLGVLELVTFVEENCAIEVHESEIIPDNFDSVSRLADFVRRKRG